MPTPLISSYLTPHHMTSFDAQKTHPLPRPLDRQPQRLFLVVRPLDAEVIPFLDLELLAVLLLKLLEAADLARVAGAGVDDEEGAGREGGVDAGYVGDGAGEGGGEGWLGWRVRGMLGVRTVDGWKNGALC